MEANLCRSVNLMSMELVAKYFDVPVEKVNGYYQELLDDRQFLGELNDQITYTRKFFQKGIFKRESIDSVDWMGVQRILMYVVMRLKQPEIVVETGVFYGGNTAFLLNGLRKNGKGKLYSFDLPGGAEQDSARHHMVGNSEDIANGLDIGFIVHPNLKPQWELIRGDSLKELPKLNAKVDVFMHDSDHAFDFISKEFNIIWDKLKSDAVVMADDLDWSNGFFKVCVDRKLFPMIITDNGKSGLLARTGVARLDHPLRQQKDIVG